MKLVLFLIAGVSIGSSLAKMQCTHKQPEVPKDWIDIVNPCTDAIKSQIKEELAAAIQYLAMAAHFSTDNINRPGFAKLFFESASEERQHAIKLIEYLLLRGELTSNVSKLIKTHIAPQTTYWKDGITALREALKLEAFVTKSIRHVIQVCEDPGKDGNSFNDYHLADFLTSVYLVEQYNGQRELAEKISSLDKMMDSHAVLGEFLFDKKLLNSED